MQLRNILASRNILLPGGSINTGDERLILEPSGNFESVEDLRQTLLNLPGSSDLVYLEDLATHSVQRVRDAAKHELSKLPV
jgi:multidrug efflux pump subunit AcrB